MKTKRNTRPKTGDRSKTKEKKDLLKNPKALLHSQTPSEEEPSSDSSTPRVSADQKDYEENPLSSEYVEKKQTKDKPKKC